MKLDHQILIKVDKKLLADINEEARRYEYNRSQFIRDCIKRRISEIRNKPTTEERIKHLEKYLHKHDGVGE
ncbi:MAG TPA: ribbon-helix-helix protein, CopG family [bacterium]|nr:ribbon-helix-helix protein, CopG family [bacterium]